MSKSGQVLFSLATRFVKSVNQMPTELLPEITPDGSFRQRVAQYSFADRELCQ